MEIKTIDVLVVGPGGSGQTYFIDFLQKNGLKTNCILDSDGLKHLSRPEQLHEQIHEHIHIKKCIFLFNHPYRTVLSHYRMGWNQMQMIKLGDPFHVNHLNIADFHRCVMQNKADVFGIEHQFRCWTKNIHPFPTLFLDFNYTLASKDQINRFLGVSLDYSLFAFKPRNSVIPSAMSPVEYIYNRLYAEFKGKAKKLNI